MITLNRDRQRRKILNDFTYFFTNKCFKNETDELLFPAHLMIEKSGINIGIIGIASPTIDELIPKLFSEGVYFTNGNEDLPEQINELKNQGADMIIVLSHLGFLQETKFAEEINGIDIILSSHIHNRLTESAVVNNPLIIQSGSYGSHLGKLTVEFLDGKITNYDHELIEVAELIIPNKKVDIISLHLYHSCLIYLTL